MSGKVRNGVVTHQLLQLSQVVQIIKTIVVKLKYICIMTLNHDCESNGTSQQMIDREDE